MVHDVYGRTYMRSFPDWRSGAPEAVNPEPEGGLEGGADTRRDQDDHHKMVKGKVWRGNRMIRTPVRSRAAIVVCFTSEPIDWLWQRLQHLDASGKPLLTLRSQQLNPFHRVMVLLTAFLTEPFTGTSLRCLFHHFSHGSSRAELRDLSAMVRRSLVSMLGQLYWRLVMVFSTWPYTLAVFCDPTASLEELEAAMWSLFNSSGCCLDPYFTRKLRNLLKKMGWTKEDLLSQPRGRCYEAFFDLIADFVASFKWGNMHIERLLALCKAATPGKCPSLERYCCAGLLSQVLQEHHAAGGLRPGVLRRKDLKSDCVPVDYSVAGQSNPNNARGHLVHMHRRIREEREQRGMEGRTLSADEVKETQVKAMDEYAAMSREARENLQREAVGLATSNQPGTTHDPAQSYNIGGERLWGMSSYRAPLRVDVAEGTIRKECGVTEIRGLTTLGETFRMISKDMICAQNTGILPNDETVKAPSCCPLVSPSLCISADRDLYADILRLDLRRKLRQVISDQGWHTGCILTLQSVLADGSVHETVDLEVSYQRFKSPALIVFLPVQASADGTLNFRKSRKQQWPGFKTFEDIIWPLLDSEVLKQVWTTQCRRLTVHRLRLQQNDWTCDAVLGIREDELLCVADRTALAAGCSPGERGHTGHPSPEEDEMQCAFDMAPTVPSPPASAKPPGVLIPRHAPPAPRAASWPPPAANLFTRRNIDVGRQQVQAAGTQAEPAPPPEAAPLPADVLLPPGAVNSEDDVNNEILAGDLGGRSRGGRRAGRGRGRAAMRGGAAEGREMRKEPWHCFSLSPIFETKAGVKVQVGWGANCHRHNNPDDGARARCKKSLGYGADALTDAQCQLHLKRWLIAGLSISTDEPNARSLHLEVDARFECSVGLNEAECDRRAADAPSGSNG